MTSRSSATSGLTAISACASSTTTLSSAGDHRSHRSSAVRRFGDQSSRSAVRLRPAPAACRARLRAPAGLARAGICNIGAAAYAQLQPFAGPGHTSPTRRATNTATWLPSLNLQVRPGRDLIFRLAASRDFARPDLVRHSQLSDDRARQQRQLRRRRAGNPFLKPITSDNFDATLEWYFAGAASAR